MVVGLVGLGHGKATLPNHLPLMSLALALALAFGCGYKRPTAAGRRNQLLNLQQGIKLSLSASDRMCSHRAARIMLSLLLLGLLNLWAAEARWTVRPRRTTTTRTTTTTTLPTTAQPDRHQHVHHWPPLLPPKAPELQPTQDDSIRLIDNFDQRSPDGQHEYRYQLSNGDTRYERTYWLPVGKNWVLARRGFYSVPLPNAQYSTVFYRADHHGYHVDTHTLSEEQPLLPRTLELPHDLAAATKSTPAAKRNSISVPERNETAKEMAMAMAMEMERAVGNATRSHSRGKVQAVVREQQERNTESQQLKLKQNKTKPSTVAKVDDILATEVGIVAVNDDDHHDDDAGVTESELSTEAWM